MRLGLVRHSFFTEYHDTFENPSVSRGCMK
jgi:hypothetical protein